MVLDLIFRKIMGIFNRFSAQNGAVITRGYLVHFFCSKLFVQPKDCYKFAAPTQTPCVRYGGQVAQNCEIGLWCNWQHVWFWSRRV